MMVVRADRALYAAKRDGPTGVRRIDGWSRAACCLGQDGPRCFYDIAPYLISMSETTKSTQAMIDETKAIQAETALMIAKMNHRLAEEYLRGSLVDRPWFPWVALPGAMAIGAGVVALLAR